MQDCPSKTWSLANKYMDWSSPGPPTQLEVEENKKITLYTKAKDLAKLMNEFFIQKVQSIVEGLSNVSTFYLITCHTWTDLVMMPCVRIPRRVRVSSDTSGF